MDQAVMSTHTPGPWTLQNDGLGVYYVNPRIEAGEDIEDPAHDSIIARCDGFGAFSGIEQEEMEANARLIAAAPALLEALERLREDYAEGCEYGIAGKTCLDWPAFKPCADCQARAAIAQARGGK